MKSSACFRVFGLSMILAASAAGAEPEVPTGTDATSPAAPAPTEVLTKDDQGRVIQRTVGDDPKTAQIWRYEYDQAGNLTKKMDPRGIATLFTYDAAGRIVEARRDEAEAPKTVVTYDLQGRITGVTVNGEEQPRPQAPVWRGQDLYIGDDTVY